MQKILDYLSVIEQKQNKILEEREKEKTEKALPGKTQDSSKASTTPTKANDRLNPSNFY